MLHVFILQQNTQIFPIDDMHKQKHWEKITHDRIYIKVNSQSLMRFSCFIIKNIKL